MNMCFPKLTGVPRIVYILDLSQALIDQLWHSFSCSISEFWRRIFDGKSYAITSLGSRVKFITASQSRWCEGTWGGHRVSIYELQITLDFSHQWSFDTNAQEVWWMTWIQLRNVVVWQPWNLVIVWRRFQHESILCTSTIATHCRFAPVSDVHRLQSQM